MFLNCPECSTQYSVANTTFDEGGREVRCAKCGHQWFENGGEQDDIPDSFNATLDDEYDDNQISDEVEVQFTAEIEEEIVDSTDMVDRVDNHQDQELDQEFSEDIPDGVKPQAQDKILPALAIPKVNVSFQTKLTSLLASLAVFTALIVGGFVFKQKIVSLWSPAAAIYDLAGMPVYFKGQELVMESLSAQVDKDVDGRDYLLLQGRIINLTNKVQSVPKLVAILRTTNGEEGDRWEIDTPLENLKPNESFTFQSDYPALPKGTGSVNLTLLPTVL